GRRGARLGEDDAAGGLALEIAEDRAEARGGLGVADAGLVREEPPVGEDQRRHGVPLLYLHRPAPESTHAAAAGSSTRKTAPPPRAWRTETSPPCSRTISRTKASPSPVPFSRVVKNGVKILSRRSAGTPGPPSRPSRRTRPASARALSTISPARP